MYCQVVYICGCLPGRIRHALAELPESLDETYARTLQEINKADWEFAHRLFQCVAVAFRPLRAEELAEFLALDFSTGSIPKFHESWRLEDPVEAVLSTCSTLVAVVDVQGSSVIQFSHFSVKEFLTSTRLTEASDVPSRRYHVSPTLAHTLVAQACLGILLHLDENVTADDLEKFPLAEYAAKHWVDHARFENVSGSVEDGMKQLFDPRKLHLATWVWIYNPFWYWSGAERDKRPLSPRGTALHYAAFCGLDVVKFLVTEHSQDVSSRDFCDQSTPLHLASREVHVKLARVLLEHGADATSQDLVGQTPLHLASMRGDAELARVLLERGADAKTHDSDGQTPLHLASMRGNLELAQVLLERGADATTQDSEGLTPLHLASRRGDVELVRVLLERGADATAQDLDGQIPLHLASGRGHAELAQVLLERSADATAQDSQGRSPLHLASSWGRVQLAWVLLKHSADVTAQDSHGLTPLHLASESGDVELAQALLEHSADVTARDPCGQTPLHLASGKGHAELARVLLQCGADATTQDSDGLTPLHLASSCGSVELARVLLERGADATAQDSRGQTPLHLASGKGHVELVHVLECGVDDVTAQAQIGTPESA